MINEIGSRELCDCPIPLVWYDLRGDEGALLERFQETEQILDGKLGIHLVPSLRLEFDDIDGSIAGILSLQQPQETIFSLYVVG